MPTELLEPGKFPSPWWTYVIPSGTNLFAKRKYSSILKARTERDVQLRWSKYELPYEIVKSISDIVALQCFWPNNLFLPDDHSSVVFWEDYVDMGAAIAIGEIGDRIAGEDICDLYERIKELKYGDFVRAVLKRN